MAPEEFFRQYRRGYFFFSPLKSNPRVLVSGFENELWVFLSSTDPHAGNEGGKSNEILQKIPAKGLLGELVGVTEIQDGGVV